MACGLIEGWLVTLPMDSFRVAKLLDTERGARASGFADPIVRNADRRIVKDAREKKSEDGVSRSCRSCSTWAAKNGERSRAYLIIRGLILQYGVNEVTIWPEYINLIELDE
jgi:hypothetical protein